MHTFVLGCGGFGGIGSAPELFGQGLGQEEAFALMDAAWALGLTWFDTADAYGGGRSEAAIGAWARERGALPTITTKTYAPMAAGGDSGLSRARVLRQIETSLERLGMPRVDLYLAHAPDPDVPWAETFQAFEELVARGVAGDYGVSNVGVGELEEALAAGRPVLVQNSHSLLDGDADVLELCAERGVRLQAFSPLAGGWLTGKYRRGEPPPPGSRMALRPGPYREFEDERVYAALDRFREAARARGTSMAALALAWVASDPRVDSVVVGPQRPQHLEPVREAREVRLSEDERLELALLFPAWASSS